MGKTYRNVYKHPDSESMFGSPHNRGFARSKKRHSHHAIRNQNKKKNINEDNIQTHFKHRKVNEYFGHTKPDKIGNVPNFSWMNLNDTIKQIGENYHKKADINQLMIRMDIIPVSIALAQAAKESGWGTSRFALEGNAIFGQWTWDGQGIAPLKRDGDKNHKILKFPILRASVKAYKNNLNTHKSYVKFRDKRRKLREKNLVITGLVLSDTLKNYAQTGSEYTKTLNQIITQNSLTDFEPVRLVNSVKQVELKS